MIAICVIFQNLSNKHTYPLQPKIKYTFQKIFIEKLSAVMDIKVYKVIISAWRGHWDLSHRRSGLLQMKQGNTAGGGEGHGRAGVCEPPLQHSDSDFSPNIMLSKTYLVTQPAGGFEGWIGVHQIDERKGQGSAGKMDHRGQRPDGVQQSGYWRNF